MSQHSGLQVLTSKPANGGGSEDHQTILSFAQYRSRFGDHHDIDRPAVYDPSSEEFPHDRWYALEHDKINDSIHELCAPLLEVVCEHPPDDEEVFNLATALQTANIIPRGQRFYAAFLGEQGIGKSSTINAVFSRRLVNVSASSSACTAYPTIITHKIGAADNTDESDVRVEYLSSDEIKECALEQARRYRDAFPRKRRQAGNQVVEEVLQIGLEEELSDEEDDEDPVQSVPAGDGPPRRTIRPSVLRGAKTAKTFFEIIFGAENSEERIRALQDYLDYLNIQHVTFADLCVNLAQQRLSSLNVRGGFSNWVTLKDEQLSDFQEELDKVWPLVKSVHLETGHALLKNNVGVLDLPGYGDDNHIRTVLIDRFREMVHFEFVVAPTSRVVSSAVQDRYLNRSIRRLGANNTLLITNKSDQLYNGIRNHVDRIAEEPFPPIKYNLTEIEKISRQGTEDRSLIRAYRDYLLKEARSAYIEREASIVRLSMQDKGVDILAVSASEYHLCLGAEFAEEDDERPKLSPEATGIPRLRHYLFHLPAQTNFRTLHHHVFETLPDIAGQIQRIIEKFEDDDRYTEMREHLQQQLSHIRTSIEALAASLPNERVAGPFAEPGTEICINSRLAQFVQTLGSPLVYYPTFSKMLRENGIPTNGKGLGRNLNNDILSTMIEFLNRWHNTMQGHTDDIAVKIDEPLQAVFRTLRIHVQTYDGNAELKSRASELLDTTIRRVGMAYGKLAALLQTKLREVYQLYTTEANVQCPIALEMKDIYRTVLLGQLNQPGQGSFSRQRAHLLQCLLTPDWPKQTLPNVIEEKVVRALVQTWKQCCQQYVTETMGLLQSFAQAMKDMCDNGQLLTSNHRRVRQQLDAILPNFETQLDQIQRQFHAAEAKHAPAASYGANANSNKRKFRAYRAATQPPSSNSDVVKRPRLNTQPPSSRSMSTQLSAWLRERSLSSLKQLQRPAIKKEPES